MALQGFLRLGVIVSVLLTLTACQTLPHHRLHHRVLEYPQKYKESNLQLIALPLSVKVKEMRIIIVSILVNVLKTVSGEKVMSLGAGLIIPMIDALMVVMYIRISARSIAVLMTHVMA